MKLPGHVTPAEYARLNNLDAQEVWRVLRLSSVSSASGIVSVPSGVKPRLLIPVSMSPVEFLASLQPKAKP